MFILLLVYVLIFLSSARTRGSDGVTTGPGWGMDLLPEKNDVECIVVLGQLLACCELAR